LGKCIAIRHFKAVGFMVVVILITCIAVEVQVSIIEGLNYCKADSGLIFVIIAHLKSCCYMGSELVKELT
jgi:uncharacterized membrane protein